MQFATIHEASQWFDHIFMHTARIVEGDTWQWVNGDYVQQYAGRAWFRRERNKYHLHRAVEQLIVHYRYKPDYWQQLLLEWPHKSETDPNRLAYTRDERSGEADRQVVTSLGKYLARHFSEVPDHVIRDVVAQHTYGGGIEIVTDPEAMIRAVMNGPTSCMSKCFDILCDDGVHRHPYAVYDPGLGWAMAIRHDPDSGILGRCLVWRDPDCEYSKIFVRSYKRERDERSSSGADEAIEAWLKSQGYAKRSAWPDGTPIAEYPLRSGGWLMPYIDGGTQNVTVTGSGMYIEDGGEIAATETDGRSDSNNCTCEACGARFNDDDEGGWVGRNEDTHVCQDCLDNEYTYVYGRRGNQYYVLNCEAVEADGEMYHCEYLSDNNIVELANGDYTHFDNAVYVESEDAYYDCDDSDVCYDDYNNRYEMTCNCVQLRDGTMCHEDDAWQCAATDYWYSNAEDYVEIDGQMYHPDDVPENEAQDESN